MKLPIKWLKEYIEVPDDLAVLSAKLTAIGHMQDGPPKQVGDDLVYDFEIRQNRSDCLSIIGLAREASVVLNTPLKNPYRDLLNLPTTSGKTKITIESDNCYRFNTITIEGLKVGKSPEWLVNYLTAYGIKPINNLVDITNFVMVEGGQPLHAFDKQKVANQHLLVRQATENEKFMALGEKEIKLTTDDLVIADSTGVLALAGVIGGEHSGISDSTNSIILEAATYNQASIRRSSIRHTSRTEASLRLEKFLSPQLTELALRRAAELIIRYCGGTVTDHTDVYPTPEKELAIEMSHENLKRIGGVELPMVEVESILKRLEIHPKEISKQVIVVVPPYFRTDIDQEADVIEEVIRIYGYGNIKGQLPQTPPPEDIQSSDYEKEELIRNLMTAAGYDEQITEPLTNEKQSELEPVRLENSLSSEKVMLRTTLEHSLAYVVKHQQKYRKQDIRIFELGKIYYKQGQEYKEKKVLGVIATFPHISHADMKGIVDLLKERISNSITNEDIHITSVSLSPLTYFFEIPLELFSDTQSVILPSSTVPQLILQDLSLIIPADVKVGELLSAVYNKYKSVLYKSPTLGESPHQLSNDKKSLFIHLSFSASNSFTGDEAERTRKEILEFVKKEFQADLKK